MRTDTRRDSVGICIHLAAALLAVFVPACAPSPGGHEAAPPPAAEAPPATQPARAIDPIRAARIIAHPAAPHAAKVAACRDVATLGPKGAAAAPPLVAALADPSVKPYAASALRAIGAGAVPDLVRGLTADNTLVGASARDVLLQMGPSARGATAPLTHVLETGNVRARQFAADVLDALGKEAAVGEALLERAAAADPDPLVRQRVASALRRIRTPRGEQPPPPLSQPPPVAVLPPAPDVPVAVADALLEHLLDAGAPAGPGEWLPSGRAAPTAAEMLGDPDPDRRLVGARQLLDGVQPGVVADAVARLRLAVADDNRPLRHTAALALHRLAPRDDALAALHVVRLRSPWPQHRAEAAAELARLDRKVPGLDKALVNAVRSRATADVRRRAAAALGKRPAGADTAAAVAALGDALAIDDDPAVRAAAVASLEALAPRAAGADPAAAAAAAAAVTALGEATTNDADSTVRAAAAASLGTMIPRAAGADTAASVAALGKAMADDKNAAVRAAAAASLEALAPHAAGVGPLFVTLAADDDPSVRAAAARSIGRTALQSIPALLARLKRPEPDQRLHAARLLADLRLTAGPSPAPALRVALKDDDADVRYAAALALARVAPRAPEVAGVLSEHLKSQDPARRLEAALALASAAPRTEGLVAALADMARPTNDQATRVSALRVLSGLPAGAEDVEGAIVPAFAAALADPSDAVRLLALRSLVRLGTAARGAVPALVKTLSTGPHEHREDAADVLVGLGPEAAFPHLVDVLNDRAAPGRPQAMSVIARAGGAGQADAADVGTALAAIAKDRDDPLRSQAVAALAALGERAGAGAMAAVREIAKDPADPLQREAFAANPQGRDAAPDGGGDVEVLLAQLYSGDNEFRAGVADRLAALGPAAGGAVPALSRMVDNRHAPVRLAAARALVRIDPGGNRLAPALLAAVRQKDPAARALLAAAVAKSPDAAGKIRPALAAAADKDPDLALRAEARTALRALGGNTQQQQRQHGG